MSERSPPPESIPAGYDEDDPYENEELSSYPDWWRRNVELFSAHGMRPYRPPRFSDGGIVPEVVAELEREHDVELRICGFDSADDTEWALTIDGERRRELERWRSSKGYSVYELSTPEFCEIVGEIVTG